MKIAITGAHGTGKTTLAKSLKESLKNKSYSVSVTPEIPRLICDELDNPKFFQRENNTFIKQLLLLIGQPVHESINQHNELLICDRSIVDHWPYTRYLFPDATNKDITSIMNKLVKKHCESYDEIFYLPIEFDLKGDRIRENDKLFQRKIDTKINTLLKEYNLDYITTTGPVSERVDQILNVLASRL